jgi:hypothetical protein
VRTDWRDDILRRVHQRVDPDPPIRRRRRPNRSEAAYASVFGRELYRSTLFLTVEFTGMLDAAAKARDVNRSTYYRRALAVMLAYDLSLPIREVLWWSPAQGRYGRVQTRRGQRDDGDGIEGWCPHPGCDGAHLRAE